MKELFRIALAFICLVLALVFLIGLGSDGELFLAFVFNIGFLVLAIWLLSGGDTPTYSKHKNDGYKCPSCGHMAGHKIGTMSKSISIGMIGLASNKLGKTYQCAHCKYMW